MVTANSGLSVGRPARNLHYWIGRLQPIAASQLAMWLGLTCLFAALPLFFIKHARLNDPDIWWHLRAGEWILQNHRIPHVDVFSTTTLGRPWVEYCWLFDVGSNWLVAHFDLAGIIWFQTLLRLAVTGILFSLVRRLIPQFFWRAVAITGMATLAMAWSLTPRPGAFSVLFFVLELYVLVRARQSANVRLLWILPVLFVVWANIHVEFVTGLFVLGVWCGEPWLKKLTGTEAGAQSGLDPFPRQLCMVAGACFFAILCNPYGFRLLTTVVQLARDTEIYNLIIEFHAMFFRTINDWAVLALLMWACFALGRSRAFRPAWAVLLAWSAWMGFRSLREVWLVAILAAVIIAETYGESSFAEEQTERLEPGPVLRPSLRMATAITVLLLLVAGASVWSLNSHGLLDQVALNFPIGAVKYIRAHHLQGPLLNELSWGGFLIYAVPEVSPSMDGRTNVHSQAEILRADALWNGEAGWEKRPELQSANLVISNHSWPLAALLRNDRRFRVVYEDGTAVLFQAVRPDRANREPAPERPPL